MSRKNVVANFAMFGTAGANMATASTTSTTTVVQFQDNIGIVLSWTGTAPVGEIFIDVSNDNFTTYNTLNFGSSIAITGNTGSHDLNINQLPYGYLRARYVKTSGTGTITASLSSKEL